MSLIPIKKGKTLRYGSCDSGKTVETSDPILNDKMARVGEFLNLQPHLVQGKTIYPPGDIEGHLAEVISFGILFMI